MVDLLKLFFANNPGFASLFGLVLLLTLTACSPVQRRAATTAQSLPPTTTFTNTPAPIRNSTHITTLTRTHTNTSTPSVTPSSTIAPEPTWLVLRGKVNEHVSCFYGPSKAYLYKYGLLEGNRLDIIGYMADTGYIEVQAIGGHNPCWMNLKFMDVQGDIQTVKPVNPSTIKLPLSPYYSGLTWAKAVRNGVEVKITWDSLELRPSDDSEQERYLLEAWLCRAGKLIFIPLGLYDTEATVMDEPGCSEPSFGRVYGVEKHGYTKALEIEWP